MKKSSSVFDGQWADRLRPSSFKDFVMDGATEGRVRGMLSAAPPNCILITGTTGNGKTTLARLVTAKLTGQYGKYSKHDHNTSRFVFPSDVNEVNCGEDTGKDRIGEIIRDSKFQPRILKRRIVLLDEVHKLSPAAISALLKPLEEPPPYTTWILCTNHPEKLKVELKNRSFWINLLDMRREEVLEVLANITEATGVESAFDLGGKEKKFLTQTAEAVVGKRIFVSPREAVTTYQSLLVAVASDKPTNLKQALAKLNKLTKSGFDAGDDPKQGIFQFIHGMESDMPSAASAMIDMAREPEAFDQLYFSLRGMLGRGKLTGLPALVFAWCVDARAWSVHSGMMPLDYVAARLIEHNERQ